MCRGAERRWEAAQRVSLFLTAPRQQATPTGAERRSRCTLAPPTPTQLFTPRGAVSDSTRTHLLLLSSALNSIVLLIIWQSSFCICCFKLLSGQSSVDKLLFRGYFYCKHGKYWPYTKLNTRQVNITLKRVALQHYILTSVFTCSLASPCPLSGHL